MPQTNPPTDLLHLIPEETVRRLIGRRRPSELNAALQLAWLDGNRTSTREEQEFVNDMLARSGKEHGSND